MDVTDLVNKRIDRVDDHKHSHIEKERVSYNCSNSTHGYKYCPIQWGRISCQLYIEAWKIDCKCGFMFDGFVKEP